MNPKCVATADATKATVVNSDQEYADYFRDVQWCVSLTNAQPDILTCS